MATDVWRPESDQVVMRVIGANAEPVLQRQPLDAVDAASARHGDGVPARGLTGEAVPPGPAPDTEAPRDALLATKLYMPPPRRDLVRRPRLTARLSAGLVGPLTLLVAPAGSGKTTVLTDWCAAHQESATVEGAPWPVAWLALDRGDNDLARFLRYVIAALQPLHASIGRGVLSGLCSPQPSDTLLTLLLNDLATLPGDVVLVLDDYHAIEDPAVHHALTFLLDHLPPRVHLVIATRVDPPLPLARLRARGHLMELRSSDLRFTTDEAAAFLHQTMGVRLSVDDMAMLAACTEGWIAGLQLAALALQGRDPAQLRAALAGRIGAHRYILDYLADEVFDRQPAEARDFLLRTSILDRMSGALCDALSTESGHDQPAGGGQIMLERLEAANLFLVPLDDTRTWYRYHHFFAGFLRERLRREHPETIAGLHRGACAWLEQQGQVAHAADHALAAADYEQAARLIEQVIAPTIWQRGELATLQRWLDQLPREVTRTRPRLCLDLAWASLWSAQVDDVEPRLQDAEHALATLDGAEPVRPSAVRALHGEIAAIRAELARQRGELATALALARQALTDLPANDRRVRGVTAGLLGGAHLWSGDATAASQAYGEAVALSRTPDTITLSLIASGRLVLTQVVQGQLHQAAATYQQTLDLAAAYGMAATPAIGVAQVGMGEVLREWNDLGAAEDLLRQGIAHCVESRGLAEMALDGYLALARTMQARGDSEGALAVLQQAEAHGRASPVPQSAERIAVARARLWLTATADVAAAQRWAGLRKAARLIDEDLGYVSLLEHLTLARLRLVQGRSEEAMIVLRRLLERAEAGNLMGSAIEILTLQARAYQEQGQVAQAMLALSRALTLAEPAGYVRLFVDEGAPMIALLHRAQERGVTPNYVTTLLAACGTAHTAHTIAGTPAAILVDPLSAREREVVRLVAAGLSTTEIAGQLFLTTGTVRNHLKSIYGKLDVHSRLQAVERARALSLL